MEKLIGLGEMVFSNRVTDILKTYALSSCVGITVHSKSKKASGMAHIVLPKTFENIGKKEQPGYYADRGIPLLINTICDMYGCSKAELNIKVFGGSDSRSKNDIFKVGYRNLLGVKESLQSMNLNYQLVDTGGHYSRTVEMIAYTGEIQVRRQILTI